MVESRILKTYNLQLPITVKFATLEPRSELAIQAKLSLDNELKPNLNVKHYSRLACSIIQYSTVSLLLWRIVKTSFAMWACPSNVQRRQWQYCSRWYMSPNLPPRQVTIIIVTACDTCRLTFLHAPKNANYVHYDHHHHEHLDYDHLNIITSSLSENLMRVRLFLLPVLMLTVMMIMSWSSPSWAS